MLLIKMSVASVRNVPQTWAPDSTKEKTTRLELRILASPLLLCIPSSQASVEASKCRDAFTV